MFLPNVFWSTFDKTTEAVFLILDLFVFCVVQLTDQDCKNSVISPPRLAGIGCINPSKGNGDPDTDPVNPPYPPPPPKLKVPAALCAEGWGVSICKNAGPSIVVFQYIGII